MTLLSTPLDDRCCHCGAITGLYYLWRGVATLCRECRADVLDGAGSYGDADDGAARALRRATAWRAEALTTAGYSAASVAAVTAWATLSDDEKRAAWPAIEADGHRIVAGWTARARGVRP